FNTIINKNIATADWRSTPANQEGQELINLEKFMENLKQDIESKRLVLIQRSCFLSAERIESRGWALPVIYVIYKRSKRLRWADHLERMELLKKYTPQSKKLKTCISEKLETISTDLNIESHWKLFADVITSAATECIGHVSCSCERAYLAYHQSSLNSAKQD
uniref:Uncharacterized protein n=1 Tax=Megaselia scalaris TaxID=36166 RepID=T1GN23_MEGSC